MNLVSSHHVLSEGTWERRRGRRERGGRSGVQPQYCHKITSSILLRRGKWYLKTCPWGANFFYWKHLALALSLGRTVLFSALTETENEHREIRVHRRIILIFYLIFIFQRHLRRGTGKVSYCPRAPFFKVCRQTQSIHFNRTQYGSMSNIYNFYQARLLWFVRRQALISDSTNLISQESRYQH